MFAETDISADVGIRMRCVLGLPTRVRLSMRRRLVVVSVWGAGKGSSGFLLLDLSKEEGGAAEMRYVSCKPAEWR